MNGRGGLFGNVERGKRGVVDDDGRPDERLDLPDIANARLGTGMDFGGSRSPLATGRTPTERKRLAGGGVDGGLGPTRQGGEGTQTAGVHGA